MGTAIPELGSECRFIGQIYSEMKSSNKSYYFKLYDSLRMPQANIKETSIHLIPICEQSMSFCQANNILPPRLDTAYAFLYVINVSNHAVFSNTEKKMLTKTQYPSLNPEVIVIKKEEPRDNNYLAQASDPLE